MNPVTAEPIEDTAPEQDLEQLDFMAEINQLIEDGKIEAVEDVNGEVRLYPV